MEENNDAPSKTIIDHSHRDVSPPSGGIQTRATDDVVQHTSSGLGRHHRQTVQDNGSETESDTDNKSYPDQSSAGGSRDSGDRMQLHLHINPSGHGDQPHYREPVSTSDTSLDVNNRGGSGGGSVLSNLLVRPGLDNPNNQSDQQPSLPQLGQVHQSSGDVRLPAISLHTPSALGSYNNSRGGPPPLVDTTRPGQLSDLHRVASNAVGVNGSPSVPSRHRPDIATNRSNWIVPPSRPTNIDGIDRSPRSAYTTQSAVHAGRDDFDYPTYQPPESLVGQRIAKTFAGHGRFVGQVVKYNSQTELFTVVYADGDTEELTRENTMNLLIEDKRIHQSKPREPAMRKPAEQQQHPKRSLISPPLLTERDNETLNGLFERHAWPALAENGWRSEIQGGSTLYVYPPWSGKNTGEPEYFTSVADTILYLASQGELLRQCFPIEVHATLFAILDGIRGGASSKRGPPAEPLAGQVKRIKAESPGPPHAASSRTSAPRPPYFEHPQQQQQGYIESYPADNLRRPLAEQPSNPPPPTRYSHEDTRQSRSGYAPQAAAIQAPPPSSADHTHRFPPPSSRHMRDDGFQHRHASHPRGEYEAQQRHHRHVGGYPPNPPSLSNHSPHHDLNAPRSIPHHHFNHPDNRVVPSQAPSPALNHHLSSFSRADIAAPPPTARFSQPPPPSRPPIGQPPAPRGNMISMSDLDKSTPLTASSSQSNPRPMGDPQPRLRMFANDQPQPSYPRLHGNEWDDQRYNGEQRSYRHPPPDRMYATDRFGPQNPPPPRDGGYFEEVNQQQQQQGFPRRSDSFPRVGEPSSTNPNADHTQDYQYSRRLQ